MIGELELLAEEHGKFNLSKLQNKFRNVIKCFIMNGMDPSLSDILIIIWKFNIFNNLRTYTYT